MAPIHIQVNCEVSLRPSFFIPQGLDALSERKQKNMRAAGHALIVAVLFATCVWHARHENKRSSSLMGQTEERAAVKELWERIGFRLVDDMDWTFDRSGTRVAAHEVYWGVVSGHDDERSDQPIRHRQWPQEAELVIRSLWHRCIALSVEKATKAKRDASKRLKLLFVAGGVLVFSLAIPLLLGGLHLIGGDLTSLLLRYGAYVAMAAVGALIVGWGVEF
jgi:hypothetical protein